MSKKKEVDEFVLYESLNQFESPCSWSFSDIMLCHKDVIKNKLEQLNERIVNLDLKGASHQEYKWRNYVLKTALSFFHFKLEDLDEAWKILDQAQVSMESKECKSEFVEAIKSSMLHVLLALKGRYYFEEGNHVKAQEAIDQIKPKESMNDVEKAGLLGIKAAIFNEFGAEYSVHVVDVIREASQLNPEEPEWQFMLGKTLRRTRKLMTFFEVPQKEELIAFENACKLKKNSAFCLFCALAYKELAQKLFQRYSQTPEMDKFTESIKGLNQKSLDLFNESLTFGDLSAQALSKVSRGLTELPWPFKNIYKAKELALKAVEMSPTNPMTLHTLAMFYERQEKDAEKALEFNRKALQHGSYGSGMDIIKINLRLNPDYDPLPILFELKEKYTGPGHMNETLVQEATYYLIVKQDLDEAIDLLMNLMKNTPDLHALNECKPMWLTLRTPISLYELLYHELKSSRNKTKKTSHMEALMKIKQNKPEVFQLEVNENFLEDLKEESRQNVIKMINNRQPVRSNERDRRVSSGGGASRGRNESNNRNDGNWRSSGNYNNNRQGGNNSYNNRQEREDRRENQNYNNRMTRDEVKQQFHNRGNFNPSKRDNDFSNLRSTNRELPVIKREQINRNNTEQNSNRIQSRKSDQDAEKGKTNIKENIVDCSKTSLENKKFSTKDEDQQQDVEKVKVNKTSDENKTKIPTIEKNVTLTPTSHVNKVHEKVLKETNKPEMSARVKKDDDAKCQQDKIIEQFADLNIDAKENPKETNDVEVDIKSSRNESNSGKMASDLLTEHIKKLSKEEMETLLKMISTEDCKEKKKAKKTGVKKNKGILNALVDSELNAEPKETSGDGDENEVQMQPPKMTSELAGNQAIRQPRGPTAENNFTFCRK